MFMNRNVGFLIKPKHVITTSRVSVLYILEDIVVIPTLINIYQGNCFCFVYASMISSKSIVFN